MKKIQRGFTLIELVVVMLILGILAIVSLPKFVDLSADAHNSTAEGVAASISSGSAINYSASLLDNTEAHPMNTATACLAVNLSKFTSTSITDIASQAVIDAAANTDPAGTFYAMAAPAGVCTAASVDSGTEISCNIGVKGGNTLATATVICTGA